MRTRLIIQLGLSLGCSIPSGCSVVAYCDYYACEGADGAETGAGDGDGDGDGSGDGDGDGDGDMSGDGDGDMSGDGDASGDGDGDASGDGDGDPGPPDPAMLELALAQTKVFEFSWGPVGAETHELMESVNGDQSYESLGMVSSPAPVMVPLHLRTGATYYLESCSGGEQCSQSNEIEVSGGLVEAVGHLGGDPDSTNAVYGNSVAMSDDGSVIVVGAWGHAGLGGNDAGKVYVYELSGLNWEEVADFEGLDGGDRLGFSVAVSGDGQTIAAGARGDDSLGSVIDGSPSSNAGDDVGSVRIYDRTMNGWEVGSYIKAYNAENDDVFGSSVALSADGHTLLVGAPGEDGSGTGVEAVDDNGSSGAGAAYVFVREQGVWTPQEYLKPLEAASNDEFGDTVALSGTGDLAVVGAPGDLASAGAVYTYVRDVDIWSNQSTVLAEERDVSDRFGEAIDVSSAGDRLVVGAPYERGNQNLIANAGAVYVFTPAGQDWGQAEYLHASNMGPSHEFGSSVAMSPDGGSMVVGAVGEPKLGVGVGPSQGGPSSQLVGAAYFFQDDGQTWGEKTYIKARVSGEDDQFGCAVALSGQGEVLAVGSCFDDGANDDVANTGAVFLY